MENLLKSCKVSMTDHHWFIPSEGLHGCSSSVLLLLLLSCSVGTSLQEGLTSYRTLILLDPQQKFVLGQWELVVPGQCPTQNESCGCLVQVFSPCCDSSGRWTAVHTPTPQMRRAKRCWSAARPSAPSAALTASPTAMSACSVPTTCTYSVRTVWGPQAAQLRAPGSTTAQQSLLCHMSPVSTPSKWAWVPRHSAQAEL